MNGESGPVIGPSTVGICPAGLKGAATGTAVALFVAGSTLTIRQTELSSLRSSRVLRGSGKST
jgi:hypothetical protein